MKQSISKARLRIEGRVQGVFYRQSTRQTARAIGVSGWVRNLSDGAVEAELTGPHEKVESLIQWMHKGPPNARVERVDVEWIEIKSNETEQNLDFEIW